MWGVLGRAVCDMKGQNRALEVMGTTFAWKPASLGLQTQQKEVATERAAKDDLSPKCSCV